MTFLKALQRIAVLEAQYAALRVEVREANRKLSIGSLVGDGRGAWAAIKKMGALLAYRAAGAWAWDHLR